MWEWSGRELQRIVRHGRGRDVRRSDRPGDSTERLQLPGPWLQWRSVVQSGDEGPLMSRRSQRGSTMVEGALVWMVFAVLLAGIMELGVIGFAANAVTFAAHRAARF